ncbi:RNA pseudouridine synthase 5 isoform X2 [Cornus florida]|uniref:RNA pseudouridine synthase 5 isoform X2 n=1 Tax=Cornus florida TaxID=4283 RepID=UPI002899E27C|nr:RNA pseudouridine synthase 5 isoform X2 [Cornus florida]
MSNSTDNLLSFTTTTHTFGEPWPEFNGGLTYHDRLPSSDHGLTLIEFYSSKYKNSAPLQGWLQRIHNAQITVDGRVVTDPNTILRAGSELVYHRLPWKEPDAPYILKVLFEDDDLIALNKPSGLQVLPGGLFQQRTVLTQLQWQASKQKSSLACQKPHPVPVHRLGRGTSGILLCAKTKHAKTCLATHFADGTSAVGDCRNTTADLSALRKISKIYRALASGILNEDEVVIKQPIGMLRYPGVAKGLYVASSSGKPALSTVYVLERKERENCTLVQVEIQSGRPHQIRIHLSFIGHPLIGDPLYVSGGQPKCSDPELIDESFAQDGGYHRPVKPVPGDCGYHLHAHQLVFSHPTTNEIIKITAPLPSSLRTKEEETEATRLGVEDDVK